jgi:hypothetical protein
VRLHVRDRPCLHRMPAACRRRQYAPRLLDGGVYRTRMLNLRRSAHAA